MSKKSKAPPAPEPEVTKPELPAAEGRDGADDGDIPSTPALDDDSLDSVPPPADLGATGEGPAAGDDEHPPVDDDAEQPPTEDEFPPDAPNKGEPIVPTLEEFLEAGYTEAMYHKRFGKNPTPNTAELRAKAAAEAGEIPTRSARRGAPSPRLPYLVWPHGPLQRDGVLHEPGSTVLLTEQEAAGIQCVSPAKADDDAADE